MYTLFYCGNHKQSLFCPRHALPMQIFLRKQKQGLFTIRPGRAWSGAFQAQPGKQDGWLKKTARPSLRRATEGELEGKLPPE